MMEEIKEVLFQSPMGIVSSAKKIKVREGLGDAKVSIPDGDSFLREAGFTPDIVTYRRVSIPDGDSFLREVPIPIQADPANWRFNPRWG